MCNVGLICLICILPNKYLSNTYIFKNVVSKLRVCVVCV
jgi:hypothetical protein